MFVKAKLSLVAGIKVRSKSLLNRATVLATTPKVSDSDLEPRALRRDQMARPVPWFRRTGRVFLRLNPLRY